MQRLAQLPCAVDQAWPGRCFPLRPGRGVRCSAQAAASAPPGRTPWRSCWPSPPAWRRCAFRCSVCMPPPCVTAPSTLNATLNSSLLDFENYNLRRHSPRAFVLSFLFWPDWGHLPCEPSSVMIPGSSTPMALKQRRLDGIVCHISVCWTREAGEAKFGYV